MANCIVCRNKRLADTYFDRDVEKAFMTASSTAFSVKTKPSLMLASQVGNMYTPSLYGGLASLLYRWATCTHPHSTVDLPRFSTGGQHVHTLTLRWTCLDSLQVGIM